MRTCKLLDATLAAFFQGDYDPNKRVELVPGSLVHELVLRERRHDLACSPDPFGDGGTKLGTRNWFVPENFDRTKLPGERYDVMELCLRMLLCVYHDRLGERRGKMFLFM